MCNLISDSDKEKYVAIRPSGRPLGLTISFVLVYRRYISVYLYQNSSKSWSTGVQSGENDVLGLVILTIC